MSSLSSQWCKSTDIPDNVLYHLPANAVEGLYYALNQDVPRPDYTAKARRIIDDAATDPRPIFTGYYLRIIALGKPANEAEARLLVEMYAAIEACQRRTVC